MASKLARKLLELKNCHNDVKYWKSQAEKWQRKYEASLKVRDQLSELNSKLFDEIARLKEENNGD